MLKMRHVIVGLVLVGMGMGFFPSPASCQMDMKAPACCCASMEKSTGCCPAEESSSCPQIEKTEQAPLAILSSHPKISFVASAEPVLFSSKLVALVYRHRIDFHNLAPPHQIVFGPTSLRAPPSLA